MKFIECKLSELGEIVGGSTPFTKNESYYGGDIPWLTPKDLANFNGRYINLGERNITEAGYKSTSVKMLPINSVLFSSRAPIGYVAINNKNEVCTNQGFKSVIPNSKTDYMFLYYLLKYNKNKIEAMGSGTTFKEVSSTVMKNIIVNVPEAKEDQIKIGKILSKIDDKIELNTQTNDNLYELASTLYKKWYDSLSSDNITTLSKFDEMGKIVMGQSPKGESYNYYNEGLPLINGAADYENGFLKAQKYTTMPTKTCNKNDLIFCIRATIGLLTICDKEYCLGRGVAGIVNINELYREYVFHLINNSIESFKNLATGSVIVGISRNDIQDMKVKIPSKEQIKKFHDIQKPLFDKMENIRQENIVLTQLRDTLLPKLMNGEIDLDKIEI